MPMHDYAAAMHILRPADCWQVWLVSGHTVIGSGLHQTTKCSI